MRVQDENEAMKEPMYHATPSALPSRSTVLALLAVAVVAVMCLAWTIGLMLLTVSPNASENWLMDTGAFDEGTFWRFIDPPTETLLLGLGGLGCVTLGYLYIIARVTIFHSWEFTGWASTHFSFSNRLRSARLSVTKIAVAREGTSRNIVGNPTTTSRLSSDPTSGDYVRLVQMSEEKRKLLDLVFKLLDFVVQFILLTDMMGKGLPAAIVVIFAAVIVLNALLSALSIAAPQRQAGLATVLFDTIFDILVSIGVPILIVVYCLSTFSFDRRKYAINLEVFPPGWFETAASINTSPVQPEIIRTALNSLRIHSIITLFARVGSNFALCRRFYQLATMINVPSMRTYSIYPKNKVVAVLLVLLAVFTAIFVEESIRTSSAACRPHPECVECAWRWLALRDNDLKQCPCITMIDQQLRVKTFDEWINPVDVTGKLAQLAHSGDLQMISLVNRKLPIFPQELQQSTKLKHISLMYTHTTKLPEWAREFTELEYLHIEGKFGVATLSELPADVFDRMEVLTLLHLGVHSMTSIPRLSGLENLKYLFIAFFLQLQELPSFEGLRNLEHLAIPIIPLVDSIPDMSPLVNLKSFATGDRGMFCCNGFIGECDLTNSLCAAHLLWGLPPATCLSPNRTSKIATPATRSMFARFPYSVCADQALKPGDLERAPSHDTMDQCGGIMFRQCAVPGGGEGMCYNTCMMAISCGYNRLAQEMRRRQIAQGVGDPCNPRYEAWLGCKL